MYGLMLADLTAAEFHGISAGADIKRSEVGTARSKACLSGQAVYRAEHFLFCYGTLQNPGSVDFKEYPDWISTADHDSGSDL